MIDFLGVANRAYRRSILGPARTEATPRHPAVQFETTVSLFFAGHDMEPGKVDTPANAYLKARTALDVKVENRFGVLPNFFRLSAEVPGITANLWAFTQAAYLDNPMPSLFKERLFVHLSRFCDVRYCIARHVGFLIGLGRPSADPRSPLNSVEEVVQLLRRSFPRGEELAEYFSLARSHPTPLAEFPDMATPLESAVFAFAAHVFLQTSDAPACQQTLECLLGPARMENLILFLAFVRTAHYWTKVHAEIPFEDDIENLLSTHEALAKCILSDPEAGAAGQRIIDELPLLRQRVDQTSALLASIVESSDDAIISKKLDGTITSWNKGAQELFGYTADEAIGQPITLIVPPERLDEETRIIESLRRGERIDHYETVRRHKDGSLLELSVTISPLKDVTGRVTGASKVARGIGERKRKERALAEQARLLDLSNDAIVVRDRSGRVTYWNKGASELYGYSREQAQSCIIHDLLCTVFPEPIEQIMATLDRENRWTGELIHTSADGRQLTVASRWALDRDAFGNHQSILETNNDITRQRRAERSLRQSEEQLRALAETLEVKVGVRTRDLEQRNVDLSRLSALLQRTQDDERRHIARELHDTAGQTMSAIGMKLERLIHESARTAPHLAKDTESVRNMIQQLNQEIRTTSYLLHPPLLDESGVSAALAWYVRGVEERSGIQIRLSLSENLGRLPQEMELAIFRIIQESLSNIIRHSGSKTATIRIAREAEKLIVEIEDQGTGITADRLAQIQHQGSGVGVAGMRERVHRFGGEMDIKSNGQGTAVLVTLPAPRATATAPNATRKVSGA